MMSAFRNGLVTLMAVLLLAGWAPGTVRASTLHVLYAFPDTDEHNANRQGAYPFAAPVQAKDGSLYGVTYWGGKNGTGVVYKLAPNGALTALHSFAAQRRGDSPNADGAEPYGSLTIGPDGALYGGASVGGASGAGVVFKITLDGEYTLLHAFTGKEGAGPCGRLVLGPDDAFYGTTSAGGAHGNGTVFKITPSGALTALHSLTKTEGAFLMAGLTPGRDGAFYGAASNSGANGTGTIFRITPEGIFTVLHTFSAMQETPIRQDTVQGNRDGAHPRANLVQASDGNFYGVAQFGGRYGSGTVFRIRPDGVFTVLYDFSHTGHRASGLFSTGANRDGAYPQAALVQASNGRLYGVAGGGGANGCGTIFSVSLTGQFAVAHTFSRISPPPGNVNTDGAQSRGIALAGNGAIYGTAFGGGTSGDGVIYRLEVGHDAPLPASFDPSMGDRGLPARNERARFQFVQAVNGGTGENAAGSFTMHWKTKAGDGLFAAIYVSDSAITVTPPDTEWMSVDSVECGPGRMFGYYRQNAPAQSGTYTWKFNGGGPVYGGGVFVEFSIKAPYGLYHSGAAGEGTGRLITTGNISESNSPALLLCFGGILGQDPSNVFRNPSGGFTLAVKAQRVDGSERAKIAIAGFLTYRIISRSEGFYSTAITAANGKNYGTILASFHEAAP